jgi:hypothetical protein
LIGEENQKGLYGMRKCNQPARDVVKQKIDLINTVNRELHIMAPKGFGFLIN